MENLKPIKPLNQEGTQKDIPQELKAQEQKPELNFLEQAKGAKVGPHAVIAKKSSKPIKKIIFFSLALIVAGGFAYFLFFYRIRVIVNTSPSPDKVTIDGVVIKSNSLYLMPGKHKILVEKQGSVAYSINRDFRYGEKLNLNFAFKPAPESTLLEQGASAVQAYENKIYFVNKDKSLGYLFGGDTTGADIIKATNASYPTIKKYSITEDGTILMILDNEAIKLVDLGGSDIVNQAQAKLPFDGSKITAFDSNPSVDSYFDGANKYIAFDLADGQWILRLISRDLVRDEIVMTIDQAKFKDLKMQWLADNSSIILTGGAIGKIDLISRTYTELSPESNFVFSQASPDGSKIIAVKSDGTSKVFSEGTAKDLDLPNLAPVCFFTGKSKALLFSNGRLVEYNFDTGNSIGYAGGEQISLPTGLATYKDTLYYTNTQGLFAIKLVKEEY